MQQIELTCTNDCGIVVKEYASAGKRCPNCGNGALVED